MKFLWKLMNVSCEIRKVYKTWLYNPFAKRTLNIPDKTKDSKESQLDLKEMDLRKELATLDHITYLLPICFTMMKEKKRQLCQFLHDVKHFAYPQIQFFSLLF